MAKEQQLEFSVEKWRDIQKNYTSEELINYVMDELAKADTAFKNKYKSVYEKHQSALVIETSN